MIIQLVSILYNVISGLIFVRVLLSWFPGSRYTKFGYLIEQLTEPFLAPFRRLARLLPFENFGWDISPILCLLALYIAYRVLISLMLR